ncbi:MAG: 50S ribosomal protein L11 methyltransferase [Hydrogenimonas sp.]|nr:50S ribosomal protein L11 methyltransferase [Hydrogenimonas sp.]
MSDIYHELKVTPSAYQELFLDFLQTLFEDTIEIGEKSLILRSEEPLEDIAWGAQEFAAALTKRLNEDVAVEVELSQNRNEDWIEKFKRSIEPVEVGDFYIYPSWERPKEGKRNITIDPALAFGSGHHETTASCIEAIQRFVKRGDRFLDVGCGSGVLGIAASMLGASVDACDTDPLAVENARKNFDLNKKSVESLWEGSAAESKRVYDVVAANIVADILCMISKDLKERVKGNGLLILSGILDSKEEAVERAYGDLELLDTIAKNEWRTKIYKKKKEENGG